MSDSKVKQARTLNQQTYKSAGLYFNFSLNLQLFHCVGDLTQVLAGVKQALYHDITFSIQFLLIML